MRVLHEKEMEWKGWRNQLRVERLLHSTEISIPISESLIDYELRRAIRFVVPSRCARNRYEFTCELGGRLIRINSDTR